MNSLLLMALILAGCLVGGLAIGLLIEWCGWWLFVAIAVIVSLTVKGDRS